MKTLRFLKFNSFILFCSALFLLLVSVKASATTYYVSPTGADTYPGTESQPFKTIQKGANTVNPGDTVIVKDGTYTDYTRYGRSAKVGALVKKGGNASNWITFKSENDYGAVLDGKNNTGDWGFRIQPNVHYVRIEGFEIKEFEHGGITANPGSAYTVTNIYIYNNIMHHMGRKSTARGNMGGQGSSFNQYCSFITWDSNIFYTNGRFADAACQENNKCYNHDHGIYIKATDSNIINNIFYDHQAGWGIQLSPTCQRVNVINNTFAGANPGRDGHIVLWHSGGDFRDIIIENNVFYQPANVALNNAGDNCGSMNDITIRNNMTTTDSLLDFGTEDDCPDRGFIINGNITSTYPLFVDANNNNYALTSSSPAIDAGLATNAPSYDRDGNTRPQGSGFVDIGAYEYGGSLLSPPEIEIKIITP